MAIKDKFDGAAEVKVVKEDGIEKPRIVMKNSQFKRHTNADLVSIFVDYKNTMNNYLGLHDSIPRLL